MAELSPYWSGARIQALRTELDVARVGHLVSTNRYGPDGVVLAFAAGKRRCSIIATTFAFEGLEWQHGSLARNDRMPSYEDLTLLHRAVFGSGWAYQVFPPDASHVNIHPNALHLWGRIDGQPALPDFVGDGGSV